ncbi:MAG: TonB-dependent receptor [Myxococcales bacterium]|nr:TonB-dependent receptor [Myxococcales bacterium]
MPNLATSKRLRILVAACAVFVATRSVQAQDDPARVRAKALLQEGAEQMEARQYDKAVDTFGEAYRLVPSPKVLYNLGIAYLSVARYADALEALEGFLREATDAPSESQETARRHIDELRPKVAALDITSDRPGAELILDGRSRGETTFDHALTIDAGPHELRARAGDATAEQRFTAQAGQRVAVTLTFAAAPVLAAVAPASALASLVTAPSAPPEGAARPVYRRPWFWVAAGAAALVATSVIVVLATSGTRYPMADQHVGGP